MDEGAKLAIAFISSFVLSMITIIVSNGINYCKNKKEVKEKLKSEIFTICEKMLLYAKRANLFSLSCMLRYNLYAVGIRSDVELSNYLKHKADSEDYCLQYNLLKADLLFKIGQLEEHWNIWEYKEIKKLVFDDVTDIFMDFESIFNGLSAEDDMMSKYHDVSMKIDSYVDEFSYGSRLISIQKLIYPAIIKSREPYIQ